jgi:hypothetical protein
MITEDQAKERWCPFARYAIFSRHGQSSAANRLGDDNGLHINHKSCRCIASQCMAWRWERIVDENLIEAIKRYRSETGAGLHEAKAFVEAHPEYRTAPPPTRGYCGLASKP